MIPRYAIDRANADAEICSWIKEQLPHALLLNRLYKQGYKISVKIDSLQSQKIEVQEKIIYFSNENFATMKKRIIKMKINEILAKAKEPFIFSLGAFLGYKFKMFNT
jgi:hypothetical protein